MRAGRSGSGKDEHHGVLAQPRKDLRPPPHWRLEAIAETPMPRTLTIGADRRHAVFIEDRDTSDVFLLHLETGSVPERLTTGRDPMPWWDDSAPQLSPDGTSVAYTDDGHVWLVPTAGGPPRKLVEGGSPRWIDARRLVISVERDDATTTRLAIVDVDDPWPRRLAVSHGELDAHGDEGEAAAVARRDRGGLHVHAQGRHEPQQRDPRGRGRRRRGAPAHRRAGHARRGAGVVARRPDDRVRVRAQRLLRAPSRGTRRRGRSAAHERGRRSPRARLASGRHPSRGREGAPEPLQPRVGECRRRQRGGAGPRRHLVLAALDRGRGHPRRVRGPRDAARDPPRRARHGRPASPSTRRPRRRSATLPTRRSRTSPTSRSTGSRSPAS